MVAIDGPGASGKSTVSRLVAARLDLPHLDTGAYYRAATLICLRRRVDLDDGTAIAGAVAGHVIELVAGRLLIDGVDESLNIRGVQVTTEVSRVAAHAALRLQMVGRQREWVHGHGGSAVVEGRDIGTVVFPNASVKVFLTARPEVRAARRAAEIASDHRAVHADLVRRDRHDSNRASSPLQPATDAVVIDASELSVEEVVDRIVAMSRLRA